MYGGLRNQKAATVQLQMSSYSLLVQFINQKIKAKYPQESVASNLTCALLKTHL